MDPGFFFARNVDRKKLKDLCADENNQQTMQMDVNNMNTMMRYRMIIHGWNIWMKTRHILSHMGRDTLQLMYVCME